MRRRRTPLLQTVVTLLVATSVVAQPLALYAQEDAAGRQEELAPAPIEVEVKSSEPAPQTTEAPAPGKEAETEPVRKGTSPALALLFSLLLPGVGHLVAGDVGRGLVFLIGAGVLWAFAAVLLFLPYVNIVCGLALAVYHLWAGIDAYKRAKLLREGIDPDTEEEAGLWSAPHAARGLPTVSAVGLRP